MIRDDIKQAIAQFRYRWKSALFSSIGVMISCLALVISGHLTYMATNAVIESSQVGDGYTLSVVISGATHQLDQSDYEDFFSGHPHILSYHVVANGTMMIDEVKIPVIGTSENFNALLSTNIVQGRSIHPNDVLPYAVINETLHEHLSKHGIAHDIGNQIISDQGIIQVMGLTDTLKMPMLMPEQKEGVAIVSLDTFSILFPSTSPSMLFIIVDSLDQLSNISHFVTGAFKERYPHLHVSPMSPAILMQQAEGGLKAVNYLIYMIVSICAGLGGIGIMNMVIADITHRKSEIALRIALGASHRAIKRMLVVETCVLCLGSGLIGVILGLITTIIIAKVTEWQFLFAPSALFNSLIFSTVVAVLASQYPASIIKKMPVAYILKGE